MACSIVTKAGAPSAALDVPRVPFSCYLGLMMATLQMHTIDFGEVATTATAKLSLRLLTKGNPRMEPEWTSSPPLGVIRPDSPVPWLGCLNLCGQGCHSYSVLSCLMWHLLLHCRCMAEVASSLLIGLQQHTACSLSTLTSLARCMTGLACRPVDRAAAEQLALFAYTHRLHFCGAGAWLGWHAVQ